MWVYWNILIAIVFFIRIQMRANFYNLNVEQSSIDSILKTVLSPSHILDDKYLVRILDILKHPHKNETAWFNQAKWAVETKFKVKFPHNKKHFLFRITDYLFNNTFNQRIRRGMLQHVREYGTSGFITKQEMIIKWKWALALCSMVQWLLRKRLLQFWDSFIKDIDC